MGIIPERFHTIEEVAVAKRSAEEVAELLVNDDEAWRLVYDAVTLGKSEAIRGLNLDASIISNKPNGHNIISGLTSLIRIAIIADIKPLELDRICNLEVVTVLINKPGVAALIDAKLLDGVFDLPINKNFDPQSSPTLNDAKLEFSAQSALCSYVLLFSEKAPIIPKLIKCNPKDFPQLTKRISELAQLSAKLESLPTLPPEPAPLQPAHNNAHSIHPFN